MKYFNSFSISARLFILLAMVWSSTTVQGAAINSKASGAWNDPATWSCTCVPTSADDVTIEHAVTSTGNVSVNTLKFSTEWSPTFGHGQLTVASGTLSVAGGTISFGNNGQSTHSLTVASGATFTTSGIIQWLQAATITVNGTFYAGSFDVANGNNGNFNVGASGSATFAGNVNITSGPHYFNIDGYFQANSLSMDGSANFNVGPDGEVVIVEDVVIKNGQLDVDGTMDVGGDFTMSGGGRADVTGTLSVDGEMNLAYAGMVSGSGNISAGSCTNGNCPTFTPVPVELVNFQGEASAAGAMLSWQTASETENAGFTVERSPDGETYQEIGFVKGQGTSTRKQAYAFTDASFRGAAYYRLRQVDYDGTVTYHEPVLVRTASHERIDVYPNPFIDVITLWVSEIADAPQRVTLYSLQGQPVEVHEARHAEQKWELSLGHLPNGIYLLEITTRKERQHLRVIKQ
ncbi:Por secretion system C-terminal sorting domain-containing protein [Catalinimonas alkaloidigena]|uniref:Por secretion system C-terminal sorting domain-containing protein n=1 Tax=Catalinimonas alkaloidigena TaxID=1075417 RepID=A0A1G9LTQ9_9BACT|nr:T9SS type A sorting domain-containing protein [Catalinimonas alkaloidigena]SDL65482.1 Por secretion system C-terminal sorting domain-containing protein [Catalinimonas alkaloidigena]